jgi:hypothetical protein
MMWNNVPHYHTIFIFNFLWIMESKITFLSRHAMTNLHAMKKKIFSFLFFF